MRKNIINKSIKIYTYAHKFPHTVMSNSNSISDITIIMSKISIALDNYNPEKKITTPPGSPRNLEPPSAPKKPKRTLTTSSNDFSESPPDVMRALNLNN